MAISRKSAKAKGQKFAQEIKHEILKNSPTLSEDDITVNPASVNGQDLILSGDAKREFPFAIECKRRAKISVYPWFEQASTYADTQCNPALFIRADNRQPLVVLDLPTLFALIKGDD